LTSLILDVARIKKVLKELGVDITGYKDDFVARRVRARMLALKVGSLEHYLDILKRNREELRRLLDNLSINVSEFFRDPWAWTRFRTALRSYIERKKLSVLRIWSAGCSHGEEPYTIAIILLELMEEMGRRFLARVYATDVDQDALRNASRGVYALQSLRNVPPRLLSKWFVKLSPTTYMVKSEVRSLVRFRRHNLITDPPLMFMDAVVCRNVLIYFSRNVQRLVLRKIHRALNPRGILFLGASEYIPEDMSDLFRTVDARARIYEKV